MAFAPQQLADFAQALVNTAPCPMAVIDRNLRVLAANRPFRDLTGEDAEGLGLLALAGGAWDRPDVRQTLEAVLEHRSFDDLKVSGSNGQSLLLSGLAVRTFDGYPELIAVSLGEMALDARTTHRLDERKVAHEIIETVREPMLVLDFEQRIEWANQSFYSFFRLSESSVQGQLLGELSDGAWNAPALRALLDAVLEKGGRIDNYHVDHDFGHIGRREMLLNAGRIDHLRLILLAFEDVTEQRRQQRHQETVLAEMAHRIKNILAVAQSLAFQTQGDSVEGFRSAYIGRLKALAVAQGGLLDMTGHGADLEAILLRIIDAHGGTAGRIQTQGPPVTLSPNQATGFALVLNELATNAAKHGALSADAGRVVAAWDVESGRIRFDWREEGSALLSFPPKKGFGIKLIEQVVSAQLDGDVELSFEGNGLKCAISVPLWAE